MHCHCLLFQDYYGQVVTGSWATTAAPAVVRLESANAIGVVLGGLDPADGTASFAGLRLRGPSGSSFNLSFSALTRYRPLTPLAPSTVTVRPCQLNEYLDPGTRDLCVNCSAGSYNLIPTHTECPACPAGATCSSACLANATCTHSGFEYAGFIVPGDGNWHSSMFSDQVIGCPKASSCAFSARQEQLQRLQVTVRDAFYRQQYLQALGRDPGPRSSQTQRHRALAERRTTSSEAPPSLGNPPPTLTQSPARPLAFAAAWFARGARSLLDATTPPPPTTQAPNPPTPPTPTSPATPTPHPPPPTTPHSSPAPASSPPPQQPPSPPPTPGGGSTEGVRDAANPAALDRTGLARWRWCRRSGSASLREPARRDDEGPVGFMCHVEKGFAAPQHDGALLCVDRHVERAPGRQALRGRITLESLRPLAVSPHARPLVALGCPDGSSRGTGRQAAAFQRQAQVGHRARTMLVDGRDAQLQIRGDGCARRAIEAAAQGMTSRVGASRGAQKLSEREPAAEGAESARPVLSLFHDNRSPFLEDAHCAKRVVVRILLSNLQVLGLLRNVPHLYPTSVQTFLAIASQVSSFGSAVSLDCSLPDHHRTVSKATIRTLINILAPLYVTAAAWVGWALWSLFLYHHARISAMGQAGGGSPAAAVRDTLQALARFLPMILVVVVFFFYPSAVQSLLEIFDCVVIDSGAPSSPLMARADLSYGLFWRQDYSQQCYVGAHNTLAMALGVPGLVLLAVGWPLICAVWLYTKTNKLYTDPALIGTFGFLFEGYQPRYCWWESVVTLRKLLIAVLVVFLHGLKNEGLELLIVSMVLGGALVLHLRYMPYEYGYMNYLEFLSLVTCTLTVLFSLFFGDSQDKLVLTAVATLVFFVNAVTLVIFADSIVRASWHMLLQQLLLAPEV
ncbi:MAG: hypothetical protein WDW36_009041 [Sanguina aurantia]